MSPNDRINTFPDTFVGHLIADQRIVRHIKKWLHAGVLEDEVLTQAEEWTPQGRSISPLLANICLHYAFDMWVQHFWMRYAHGDMIVVRFADDVVMGFQYRADADPELRKRFLKFNLELHPISAETTGTDCLCPF